MTSLSKKSRSRPDQRQTKPRPMREGANDRRIVQLLYDYRLLSQRQLEQLLGRSKPTVQRLLRRLYDHRYVERLFLPIASFGSSPALYILDAKGIDLLRRMGLDDFTGLPGKTLSGMYLEHSLAINQFRIAIHLACEQQGWDLKQWVTENAIKADYDRVKIPGKKQAVALVPDGYFSISVPEKGTTHFFLELDRGTMQLKRFQDKVQAYIAYHRSGDYTRRYEAEGFRVLTVVDGIGNRRVHSLHTTTDKVKHIGRRFWFTHLSTISVETVLTHRIWHIAGEEDAVALFERK